MTTESHLEKPPPPGKDPLHLAIIMDGNGRWAAKRAKPRIEGHRAGVEALRRTVRGCRNTGLSHLTVFSFSTENWGRPRDEIDALFDLLRRYAHYDLDELVDQGVRVRIVGARSGLGQSMLSLIDQIEKRSAQNNAFHLNIAFNYGGRAEITDVARTAARASREGRLDPDAIDENWMARHLWTAHSPDPDLVIRTGGEKRISNFLLWGAAYAEWVFLDQCWPEFTTDHLHAALETFRQRHRRFGMCTPEWT